jgi:hypothetical protein
MEVTMGASSRVGGGVALWVLGAVCIAGSVGAGDFDACTLVTPAEFQSIAGGTLDGPPGGELACTADLEGYQKQAQVQVNEGFGMGSNFEDLIEFWKDENVEARGRGAAIEERTIDGAFCFSTVQPFLGPRTKCMRAKGRLVLYATLSATSGDPPSVEAVMKLLDTAFARLD